MRHDQRSILARKAKSQEPFLRAGVIGISECQSQWVPENGSRFIEADLMPSQIFRSLGWIPFELHLHSIGEDVSANLTFPLHRRETSKRSAAG